MAFMRFLIRVPGAASEPPCENIFVGEGRGTSIFLAVRAAKTKWPRPRFLPKLKHDGCSRFYLNPSPQQATQKRAETRQA